MAEEKNYSKTNGSGVERVINATKCSTKGFKAAYINEAAFRQELFLFAFLFPLSFFISENITQLILLIISLLLVLFAEIINSAIEAVVDRVGMEYHELSGRAKDLGSATVFIGVTIFLITWVGILIDNYT